MHKHEEGAHRETVQSTWLKLSWGCWLWADTALVQLTAGLFMIDQQETMFTNIYIREHNGTNLMFVNFQCRKKMHAMFMTIYDTEYLKKLILVKILKCFSFVRNAQ